MLQDHERSSRPKSAEYSGDNSAIRKESPVVERSFALGEVLHPWTPKRLQPLGSPPAPPSQLTAGNAPRRVPPVGVREQNQLRQVPRRSLPRPLRKLRDLPDLRVHHVVQHPGGTQCRAATTAQLPPRPPQVDDRQRTGVGSHERSSHTKMFTRCDAVSSPVAAPVERISSVRPHRHGLPVRRTPTCTGSTGRRHRPAASSAGAGGARHGSPDCSAGSEAR